MVFNCRFDAQSSIIVKSVDIIVGKRQIEFCGRFDILKISSVGL